MQAEPTDRKDCINCKQVQGMKLTTSWLSVIEENIMHVRWECETCHARDWETFPMPETKI